MEQLETERLTIRRWTLSERDRRAFHKLNSHERVMRFYPWRWTRAQSDERLEALVEKNDSPFFWSAACLRESGEPIGFTGLNHVNFEAGFTPAVEIGWRYCADHWRQGYATEAAKALLKKGFEENGLEEIVAFAVHDNVGSIAVMKRLGMKHMPNHDFDHPNVGLEHFKLRPHVVYALSRQDWQAEPAIQEAER